MSIALFSAPTVHALALHLFLLCQCSIVITIKADVAYSESQSSDMPHKTQLGYTETTSVARKSSSNLSSKPTIPPTLIKNGRSRLVYAR